MKEKIIFKKINIENIQFTRISGVLLLCLILIYYAQGVFYAQASIISRSALALYVSISAMYMTWYIRKRSEEDFGYVIGVFILINTIYWIIGQKVINGFSTLENYKSIVFIFITFFPFYYFIRYNVLSLNVLRVFVVLLVIINIYQYKYNEIYLLSLYEKDEVVNNVAYNMVAVLPMIVFFRKHRMVFAGMYIVLLYFVIASSKRGALITFMVGSIILLYFYLKEKERKQVLINKTINVVLVGCISYFVYYKFQENYYVQQRMQSAIYGGNSSGRDVLYEGIVSHYMNSDNIINILFGYGFNASIKIVGNYAHNDWLEILIGQGVFGIILYVLLLYKIWKYYTMNRKNFTEEEKSVYIIVMMMWLSASMFSMVYTSNILFTYLICVAYVMAVVENRKNHYKRYHNV